MIFGLVDQLANWAVIIAFVVGIPATLGGIIVAIRHGGRAKTVEIQNEEITALTQRQQTLQEENARLESEVSGLRIEVRTLRELVTSAAKVDQLRAELAAYHGEMATALSRVAAAVEAMTKAAA